MKRILAVAFLVSILCPGLVPDAGARGRPPATSSSCLLCTPDPANSETPGLITLVARGPDGNADPLGTYTVTVRGYSGGPRENTSVVLYFADPHVRISTDQGDPNVIVDCLGSAVRAISDENGRATFRVIGSATNTGVSPGATAPSMEVYADGVFFGNVRVATLDQNGIAGVNGDDHSLFLADYFSGQPFARSDYDGNGAVDGNDPSLWLAAFFAGGSAQSGGSACP